MIQLEIFAVLVVFFENHGGHRGFAKAKGILIGVLSLLNEIVVRVGDGCSLVPRANFTLRSRSIGIELLKVQRVERIPSRD